MRFVLFPNPGGAVNVLRVSLTHFLNVELGKPRKKDDAYVFVRSWFLFSRIVSHFFYALVRANSQ